MLSMTIVGTPVCYRLASCDCSCNGNPLTHYSLRNATQVYTAPEVLAYKPYNTQVDVYSFAITLLEIGCRDHRFVVHQFLDKTVGPLRIASITATDHDGFRPIPKEEFVEEFPELWALVSLGSLNSL